MLSTLERHAEGRYKADESECFDTLLTLKKIFLAQNRTDKQNAK